MDQCLFRLGCNSTNKILFILFVHDLSLTLLFDAHPCYISMYLQAFDNSFFIDILLSYRSGSAQRRATVSITAIPILRVQLTRKIFEECSTTAGTLFRGCICANTNCSSPALAEESTYYIDRPRRRVKTVVYSIEFP